MAAVLLTSFPALAMVNVNRHALEVAQWVDRANDAMDRARTFYRALEAMATIPPEGGSASPSSFLDRGAERISPVAYLYKERKTLKEIRDGIPALFGEEEFKVLMPDWPALAPVTWDWIEPVAAGLMITRAGEELSSKDESAEPLWMVGIALPLPDKQVMASSFFDFALANLLKQSPTLRFEETGSLDGTWNKGGEQLIFTVYPSASAVREILETMFKFRAMEKYSTNVSAKRPSLHGCGGPAQTERGTA